MIELNVERTSDNKATSQRARITAERAFYASLFLSVSCEAPVRWGSHNI